jgi:predicted TPR repeat methyltransferase
MSEQRQAVTTTPDESLPPRFFDTIYAEAPDPWSFATSAYEREKYATTLAELPRRRYRSAFEIGCSIGVLTEQLAARCDALLAVDVAERALEQARLRCAHLPQVRCELLHVPEQFPGQQFDLILVSEVGYYWSHADLRRTRELIVEHLVPGGHLMLVHFTNEVKEYPISGDAVHEAFVERAGMRGGERSAAADEGVEGPGAGPAAPLRHLRGRRERHGGFGYRLDLFERR